MNITLEKFMGLAITALVIAGLVFGLATNMLKTESSGYQTTVTDVTVPTDIYTP